MSEDTLSSKRVLLIIHAEVNFTTSKSESYRFILPGSRAGMPSVSILGKEYAGSRRSIKLSLSAMWDLQA